MIRFGLDRLLADPELRRPLAGKRVALLAHPASVTRDLTHSLDALIALPDLHITAAFGPQHGLRGDKQDNMVESPDFLDPRLGIPVFSLYGEVRRPTATMMDRFDVLLVDLQAHLGIDLKLASERSTIIGGALQRGFTDAVARLQGVTGLADRTVRVGAAGQHAGTCNGNSGKSGIFHKVTAGECIGHVRSSFKKQISTALRHYL